MRLVLTAYWYLAAALAWGLSLPVSLLIALQGQLWRDESRTRK